MTRRGGRPPAAAPNSFVFENDSIRKYLARTNYHRDQFHAKYFYGGASF